MKFVILFITALFAITENERKLIDEINSNPLSTWKAKEYPENVMTTEKMVSRLIPLEHWKPHNHGKIIGRQVEADTSFDAREVWGKLILPVRDQGNCGSCWAFAVAETTGDRIGIETGVSNGDYSPFDLAACDTTDEGCDGGYVDLSWNWVVANGIALDSCLPYTDDIYNGNTPKCPSTCTNGSAIVRTKATSAYPVPYSSMQDELAKNGPYEVAFDVYLDFEFYTSGVYQKWDSILNILLGGHAVLLSGWGVDGSTPYWLIQNSWAADWGENGYFRIIRGTDECGIEDEAYAGIFN